MPFRSVSIPRKLLLPLLAAAASVLLSVPAAGASKPPPAIADLKPAPAPGRLGPELVPVPDAPVLAAAASVPRLGRTVDGIRCQRNEKLAFHLHVHLTLFVNGEPRKLPAGIGIWPPLPPQSSRVGAFVVGPENCFSWLSTHFADGIVHVESPVTRSFALGELFDVWGQPLSATRLGPAHGTVTAIVDGRFWTGDPRRIPLREHTQIQLESGTPLVAPQTIRFPGSF